MPFNPLEKFPSFIHGDMFGMRPDPMLASYYSSIESIGERLDRNNINEFPKILDQWWRAENTIAQIRAGLGDVLWAKRSEWLRYITHTRVEKGNEFPKVQYLTHRMLEENTSPNNRGRIFGNMVLVTTAQALMISTNDTPITPEQYTNHLTALEIAVSDIEHPIEKAILKQILKTNKVTYESLQTSGNEENLQTLDKEIGKLVKMLMYASDPMGYIRSQGDRTVNSVFEEIDQLFI